MLNAKKILSAYTVKRLVVEQGRFLKKSNELGVASFNKTANYMFLIGAITKLKKSIGWTIDKFRLNNSLAINGRIWRFAYRKIEVQRCTFLIFWNFCCSYHRIMAASISLSEGRDKKVGFVETNSSKYSISKSKMQGIFEPDFASHRIK